MPSASLIHTVPCTSRNECTRCGILVLRVIKGFRGRRPPHGKLPRNGCERPSFPPSLCPNCIKTKSPGRIWSRTDIHKPSSKNVRLLRPPRALFCTWTARVSSKNAGKYFPQPRSSPAYWLLTVESPISQTMGRRFVAVAGGSSAAKAAGGGKRRKRRRTSQKGGSGGNSDS